jgi:hypothetical protein
MPLLGQKRGETLSNSVREIELSLAICKYIFCRGAFLRGSIMRSILPLSASGKLGGEIGEQPRVRTDRSEVSQVEPLLGKIVHQRLRPRVGKHAPHFLLELDRLLQFAVNRGVQQFVVRNAAPKEEGEARRQVEIAEGVRGVRRNAGRILLDTEQKPGLVNTARNAISIPFSKPASSRPSR